MNCSEIIRFITFINIFMAHIKFTNEEQESFELGLVSFNIIHEQDILDKYQEDNDEASEVIFLCTIPGNCQALSHDIKNMERSKGGRFFRNDLMEKFDRFADFLSTSSTVKAILI